MDSRTPMEVYQCDEEFDLVQIQTKAGHISISVAEDGEVTINTESVNLAEVRILDEMGDSWKLEPKIVHLYEWHGGYRPNKACPTCQELGFFPWS